MSITLNKERIGSFTSSEIYRLLGSKKVQATYIEEKKIELRLGRSIDTEAYSKPMAWGSFLEMFVFDKIGLEYEITSNTTDIHPTIKGWSGSKDLIVRGEKIGDIKCYQPKRFAQLSDALILQDVANFKAKFAKEYWQLVSNAIINNVPEVESIVYMPYQSELSELREHAENYEGADQWKYRFIYESDDVDLAYLPDGGYYQNLNRFQFVVPESDKTLLTNAVLSATKLLK